MRQKLFLKQPLYLFTSHYNTSAYKARWTSSDLDFYKLTKIDTFFAVHSQHFIAISVYRSAVKEKAKLFPDSVLIKSIS